MENLQQTTCVEGMGIEVEPQMWFIAESIQQDNVEEELYFYLSDHLGSSSWITDASGNVDQHLAYMPFGESFIDQRASGHDIRFKFTGKERDSKTGMDYFGARYYASDLSIWLSVDPLADQYPSTSPFMYVLGNPIKFIDPNGMNHDYYKNKAGDVIHRDGHAATVTKGGEEYKNIGSTYCKDDGFGYTTHYVQDTPVAITSSDKSFGQAMQNDKAYVNAVDVANSYSYETVKDVYMQAFNTGYEDLSRDAIGLMGSIVGAVLTVESAVVVYAAIEGAMAAGSAAGAASGAVDDAVNAARQWLGKDYKKIVNDAGDMIYMSKDGAKKIRFDMRNTHGDLPHVHLEVLKGNKWVDALKGTHRIYPK